MVDLGRDMYRICLFYVQHQIRLWVPFIFNYIHSTEGQLLHVHVTCSLKGIHVDKRHK